MNADIAIIAILAFGGFSFGIVGFGFGLVTIPLLTFFLPLESSVLLQFPFVLILVLTNAFLYRRKVPYKAVGWLLIIASLAVPLGFLSLEYFPESIMKRALSILIVLWILSQRLGSRAAIVQKISTGPWALLWGSLSGWFHGAYTTGGPPAVIYLASSSDDPEAIKGAIGLYFAVLFLFSAVLYVWAGAYDGQTIVDTLVLSPAVIVGLVLGKILAKRISGQGYKTIIQILLFVAAIMIFVRA